MRLIAKVTSKGQTTLPIRLRNELGLSPGDRVSYVRQPDGTYRIEKAAGTFADLRGIIKLERPISTQEILDAVDEARAAIGGARDRN